MTAKNESAKHPPARAARLPRAHAALNGETPAPAPDAVSVPPDAPKGQPGETGGPKGPEPTRYGDWERKGRCIDF